MKLGSRMMVKPGTFILMMFMLGLGLALYSWADTSFDQITETSQEEREDSIACAGLQIKLEDITETDNSSTVFFTSNRELDAVYVRAEGDRNFTRTIESVEREQLRSAEIGMDHFSTVDFRSDPCEHTFTYGERTLTSMR